MFDFLGLMKAIATGPRSEAEIDRIAKTPIEQPGGFLVVSTVNSHDMGPETAILDEDRAMPVERYETREEAVIGHEKWCGFAKTCTKVSEIGYGRDAGVENVYDVKLMKELPE